VPKESTSVNRYRFFEIRNLDQGQSANYKDYEDGKTEEIIYKIIFPPTIIASFRSAEPRG